MFVFLSVLTGAMWFLVRLAYDVLAPGHRLRAELQARRFWTITLVAAAIASAGAWVGFRLILSAFAGWYAAIVVAVTYVGLCVALRALIGAFAAPEDDPAP
jgi:hypothetical protein